ncbi:hypothetical protein IAT38_006395 [Cryptococcus sp. DSM 104549]
MDNISRRVSYILPAPSHTDPPPLLSLPPLGQDVRGHVSPFLIPKPAQPPSSTGTILGSRNPFLSASQTLDLTPEADAESPHPRHCLGVNALALDTSTVLAGADAPGGILYTGGRDGLVASWDLGVPHRARSGVRYGSREAGGARSRPVRWERIGDGAEFFDNDDDEDEDGSASASEEEGWVKLARQKEVGYEDRWEVDREAVARAKPPRTTFRQSAQTHTDWVNALLLCNHNRTVITASSDRTIRAWTPHAAASADGVVPSPALVGSHSDYVKCLAWAKGPGCLWSGALDRRVCMWDVGGTRHEPIVSVDLTEEDEFGGVGPKPERASVYALATDHGGNVLAAGTPERTVRLWDSRAGVRSLGKLVGHSDTVRSIIFSEDGRYMLTGSSDTTIKLWSLAAHRCLHTFSHHDSSVWSLASRHPNLERFYSGSRDGRLCAVDLEGCTDMSDGECVVLAREGEGRGRPGARTLESASGDEGIRAIVGMDDEYVWTATGEAHVKRWRDVGRRVTRLDEDFSGAAYSGSLGSAFVPSAAAPATEGIRNKRLSLDPADSPLARTDTRDSKSVAFAPTSSPRYGPTDSPASPTTVTGGPAGSGPTTPASALPSAVRDRLTLDSPQSRAHIPSSIISDISTDGEDDPSPSTRNGLPYASLVPLATADSPYSFDLSRDPIRTSESVGDAHGQGSLAHLAQHESTAGVSRVDPSAAYDAREVASEATPLRAEPDAVISGRSGLVRSLLLNDRQHVLTVDTDGEVACWSILRGVCVGRFSTEEVAAALDLERGGGEAAEVAVRKHSQDVLEMVKERVEGETAIMPWCQVDTKIGSLVVHLDESRVFEGEIYAEDVGIKGEGIDHESRINLGKWALANLFRGLIKAEEREVTESALQTTPSTVTSSLPSVPRSPTNPNNPSASITISTPIDRPPVSPGHRKRALTGSFSGVRPPALNIPGLVSPAARPAVLPELPDESLSKSAPEASGYWQAFRAQSPGTGLTGLTAIPPSPAVSQAASGPGSGTTPLKDGSGGRDYFTLKNGRKTDPSPPREGGDAGLGANGKKAAGAQTPGTPGSLMGRFKGFGKKKQAEAAMAPVVEQEVPPEDTGPKLSERDQHQLLILDEVRSHHFHPPPPWEAPPIDYPPSTALLISEDSKDAGAWVVTYRSQVSSTERDMEALEMNSPLWLLDYLFANRIPTHKIVKTHFQLEPLPGSGLPPMPGLTNKLAANRVLRAKKISAFIAEHLNAAYPPQAPPTSTRGSFGSSQKKAAQAPDRREFHPDDFELVLGERPGNELVNPDITLATLKAYYGVSMDILLYYKLKEGVSLQLPAQGGKA